MKVLSIGSSQANFLVELYGQISESSPEIEFTLTGTKRFSDSIKYSNEESIKYLDIEKLLKKRHSIGSLFWNFAFNRKKFASSISFREEVSFIIFTNKFSIKKTFRHFFNMLNERYNGNVILTPIFAKYDIVQVQFLMLKNIKWSWYIPEKTKVISTFWGSDLFRNSGVDNTFYLSHLLRRTDIITAQSLEMRETILAKFGRAFISKFRKALFALPDNVFDKIDNYYKGKELNYIKSSFLEKLDLDDKKPVIVIGHNGSSFNNHLEIFRSFLNENKDDFNKYNYIFPFTYLPDGPRTKLLLKSEIKNFSNCKILDEYLSWRELAALRVSTDYFIHAPQSDAMSGALTESIYSGAVPIVGSWLPYSNYDRLGIKLIRVDDFSEIPKAIYSEYNVDIRKMKRIINEFLTGEQITINWIEIYSSLK